MRVLGAGFRCCLHQHALIVCLRLHPAKLAFYRDQAHRRLSPKPLPPSMLLVLTTRNRTAHQVRPKARFPAQIRCGSCRSVSPRSDLCRWLPTPPVGRTRRTFSINSSSATRLCRAVTVHRQVCRSGRWSITVFQPSPVSPSIKLMLRSSSRITVVRIRPHPHHPRRRRVCRRQPSPKLTRLQREAGWTLLAVPAGFAQGPLSAAPGGKPGCPW